MTSPELQKVIDYFYSCDFRDVADYLNRQTEARTDENENENENK